MNEIKRYEFDGRAIEFAPRSEGRVGAPLKQVAAFYGVSEAVIQDLHRKADDGEFRASESWTESVSTSHRNESGVTAKAHVERFFDPPGALRVGMKIRKSDRALKTRDFILYTIIPEWVASKTAPKLDMTAEFMRLLGNKQADNGRLIGCVDKLGTLLSQMFSEIKRERADERTAALIDNAGGDLFTGKGDLTPEDQAVVAALSTSGPFADLKSLANAAHLTQKATALSLAELAKRDLVRREKGKIELAPRKPRLLNGGDTGTVIA